MAGLPYTAACSPKTMTFPGADTMKVGAIGDETFLSMTLRCISIRCGQQKALIRDRGQRTDKRLSSSTLKWGLQIHSSPLVRESGPQLSTGWLGGDGIPLGGGNQLCLQEPHSILIMYGFTVQSNCPPQPLKFPVTLKESQVSMAQS